MRLKPPWWARRLASQPYSYFLFITINSFFTFTRIIMHLFMLSLLTFACIVSGTINVLHLLGYCVDRSICVLARCQCLLPLRSEPYYGSRAF